MIPFEKESYTPKRQGYGQGLSPKLQLLHVVDGNLKQYVTEDTVCCFILTILDKPEICSGHSPISCTRLTTLKLRSAPFIPLKAFKHQQSKKYTICTTRIASNFAEDYTDIM